MLYESLVAVKGIIRLPSEEYKFLRIIKNIKDAVFRIGKIGIKKNFK
jgi:hypothetical protein